MESPFPPMPRSALLLAAHGSATGAGDATRDLARRLRDAGLFGEVACGFWKEKPGLREALDALRAPEVFVVPNFMAEGYFVRGVLPRELGLAGAVTARENGQVPRLCRAAGTSPRMAELILNSARAAAPDLDFSRAALLVLGHGTPRDARSTETAEAQVRALRALGVFAEVHAAFMESPPLIAGWRDLTPCREVVAVPFFAAGGPHANDDIPRLLGEAAEGRRLFYSRPVGEDPGMFDVVLDLVRACAALGEDATRP